MASFAPYKLAEDLGTGKLDFTPSTGSSFKAMLLASTYTASKSQSHNRRSDVTAHEVSGTGYAAGGVAITVASATLVTNELQVTFNPATWSSPAGPGWTPHWMVIYENTGVAANDIIVQFVDLTASPQASNGTTWTGQLSGPVKITIPVGT